MLNCIYDRGRIPSIFDRRICSVLHQILDDLGSESKHKVMAWGDGGAHFLVSFSGSKVQGSATIPILNVGADFFVLNEPLDLRVLSRGTCRKSGRAEGQKGQRAERRKGWKRSGQHSCMNGTSARSPCATAWTSWSPEASKPVKVKERKEKIREPTCSRSRAVSIRTGLVF